MAEINYTASTPKKSYTRRIGDNGFLGADFSTAPIFASDRRFRDLKNVWKDYKSGSGVAIETIPGYRCFASIDASDDPIFDNIFTETETTSKIHGIFQLVLSDKCNSLNVPSINGKIVSGNWCIVHCGRTIKCYSDHAWLSPYNLTIDYYVSNFNPIPDKDSFALQVKDSLLLFCDGRMFSIKPKFDFAGLQAPEDIIAFSISEKIPDRASNLSDYGVYVPTTYIDGEPYEQKNMLTLFSKEQFTVTVENVDDNNSGIAANIYLHEKVLIGTGNTAANYKIHSVTVRGTAVSFRTTGTYTSGYQVYSSDSTYITSIYVKDTWSSTGNPVGGAKVTVTVVYKSDETKFTSYKSYDGYKDRTTFNESNPDYAGTAFDAIAGCTICASFDDRIFLAGNPKLPNTVFYSQRDLTGYNNPTYFGILNYNNLGMSNAPIKAMIPSATSLCVLKDDSATDPTMYFLTGVTTEHDLIPRIYTVECGLPGIGCKGAACNFLDDIVFMSRNGVIGIDKQAVNLERTLGDRSALINGKLLLEDVTQAVFAEAEGYLWCLFKNNGHVYLADSRAYTQGAGYEWYFIDSVGSWESTLANPEVDYLQYKDDIVGDEESVTIYDEDDTEHLTPYVVLPRHTDGAQALDEYGNPIESSATYTVNPDGVTHDIILVENPDPNHTGTYFQVEKTGEKIGGTFHPATCMVASNDRIFFGTDNGDLLTFNNDKRGERAVSEDETEPNRYPFMLRPEWYSFCGHRIESFVETSDDDGGIGNLTKDTVRRSCVVDMKAMLGSKYKITTYTDRDGWKNDNAASGSMNDASQTMLDAVNFSGDEHINVQIRERARKWVHKRYRIESNGFCSPFGLYRITYDYELNGRIK